MDATEALLLYNQAVSNHNREYIRDEIIATIKAACRSKKRECTYFVGETDSITIETKYHMSLLKTNLETAGYDVEIEMESSDKPNQNKYSLKIEW